MNINHPLSLLGDLTPAQFMKDYWHKKPLLIKNAIQNFKSPLGATDLFELAMRDDVESRLIKKIEKKQVASWALIHGPIHAKTLPSRQNPDWTILVQGVNLYDDRAAELMRQFRFLPEARMDDLMISYATKGGGVGPHFDSYDVFLLQAEGTRRWRISTQQELSLLPDLPLKILANFEAEQEYFLEAGDMLYLPPNCAHDGVAMTHDCMTYSVGFRAPTENELANEILLRMADEVHGDEKNTHYQDPTQEATVHGGAIPASLLEFATKATLKVLEDKTAIAKALGEYLTEPKMCVQFEPFEGEIMLSGRGICLDKGSRMMYDSEHIFINGESFLAGGEDAQLLRKLADGLALSQHDCEKLSQDAADIVADWIDAGWVQFSN